MNVQPQWVGAPSSTSDRASAVSPWGSNAVRSTFARVLDQLENVERHTFVAALFVFSLLIRLAALLSLRQVTHLPGMQEGADGIEFEQFARALASGRGFVHPNGIPTSFRAPGFPIFVSLIYRATHSSVFVANLSFTLLGALICVLTYWLAREIVPEAAARLSAVLLAVYFPAIYFSTVWLSEPLFMASIVVSLLLFLKYLRSMSMVALAASGLLLSWSILVRPFALLLLPVLLAFDFARSRGRAVSIPLLLLCSILPVSIWTARNYRVHHAFVLVATNGGSTFYGGNNDIVLRTPQYLGAWVATTHLPGRAQIQVTPNEYAHDQMEWRLGKQWVLTHVKNMPLLLAMKVVRFSLPDVSSQNRKFVLMSVVGYIPFVPMWIFGVRAVMRPSNRTVPWRLMHLTFASTVVTALIFWGSPRFRDAIAPVLMIYAAYGLYCWTQPHASSSFPETLFRPQSARDLQLS